MILVRGIYQLCYSERQASSRPANLGFVENLSTILTHPYLLSSTLNGSGQHPENLLQCAPFFLSCTSPDQLFCCSRCQLHWLVCVTFELLCFDWTSFNLLTQVHRTASFTYSFSPHPEAPCTIQSGSGSHSVSCTIRSMKVLTSVLYNINLGATHTTILSIRGVQIPIDLVSSTMDSFRRRVVLFKSVRIVTSDLKSEFLCQSSPIAQKPQTPLNHLVHLGYLPRPRTPRITLIVTV